MRSSARSLFTTIRTEGAILPSELLERIAKGKDFEGLSADSYHLLAGQKLNEVIERSWKQVLVAWRGFKEAREKSGDLDSTGTSLTRERWLYPLFQELGFGRMPAERKAREIDGREYFISHYYDHVPIHLVGYKIEVDRRTPGIPGAAKTAPHSLVQEFLNRTEEHLWAIVSNGLRLRLLRDNKSLTRQAYVEFDLEAMLEGEAFADFRVLWLICHQSRFEAEKPTDCWLEKWSKIAGEQGVRALDKLRGGVEEAIRALGKGFLAHRANHLLRSKLRDGQLDRQDYYRQILRIVYRLLFLFVAEDRDLLLLPELQGEESDDAKRQRRLARVRYQQHFGTQRLRSLSQSIRGTQHPDLWRGLQLVMRGLGQEGGIPALAVPALGSYLWSEEACPDLAGMDVTPVADIANVDLLIAVRALAVMEVEGRRTVVNYAHLRSEELGSVYESLLELHPQLNAEAGTFDLHSAAGNERKTTGSYYTPDSLVQCLLDSALEPVMDEKEALARRVAQKIISGHFELDRWTPEEIDLVVPRGADPQEALALRVIELADLSAADRLRVLAEAALLGMRVCDPACGSGHFLIAAAHRIARRVARVRTGDEEPTPEALQHAMRDVVGRCLYGVDINPMALELAKVALWMEAIEPGKPLGFLDAHFQCGNALLGTTPDLIAGGLPDGAFTALTGDDKKFVSALKRRNKQEREGGAQQEFLTATGTAIPAEVFTELAKGAQTLFEANADSLADIQRIAANYEEFRQSPAFLRAKFIADIWCAAFVWPKVEADQWKDRVRKAEENGLPLPSPRDYPEPPTHDLIQRCAQHPEPWKLLSDAQRDMLERLTYQFRFIQWHVLFADVFRTGASGVKAEGGFDCMPGNPPWEHIEMKEIEFFAQRSPEIAKAATAAARKRAIELLASTNPVLMAEYGDAKWQADGETHLIRASGSYPLCARGRINVYTIFAELGRCRLSQNGLLGMVLPSGIVSDDTTKFFFQDVIASNSLHSVMSFENEEFIFPGVHHATKFCLFTSHGLISDPRPKRAACFLFFARSVEQIREPDRVFHLTSDDIDLLNPNTKTCPTFRYRRDAELSKAIYRRMPILIKEKIDESHEENPWGIRFRQGLFNMSSDSNYFKTGSELEAEGWVMKGNDYFCGTKKMVPLYEGKMFWHFDHRFGTYRGQTQAQANQGKLPELDEEAHSDPGLFSLPRYWVEEEVVESRKSQSSLGDWFIAFRDVTSSVVLRTAVFSAIPGVAVGHTSPILVHDRSYSEVACLLCSFNSFIFDYCARQKVAGSHLTFGYLKQLPMVRREMPLESPQWDLRPSFGDWAGTRCIELVFNSFDMNSVSVGAGYDGPPFIWNEERRFWIRAELDAAFFHLYLGTLEEWTRTGSPQLLESFPTPRHVVDYIMETFPIVKRKDIKAHGSYRTKVAILELYDEMAEVMRQNADAEGSGRQSTAQYQTGLNPPPGPPVDTEGNYLSMYQLDRDNWPSHIHPPHSAWDNSLLDAWFGVCQKHWTHLDDDQIFPWDGREAFVYALIPYLVREKSGESFEFYRDAALLASHQERCEALLLNDDLKSQYRAIMNKLDWLHFPDAHRVRIGEVRRRLQAKQLIATDATSGATTPVDEQLLPSFPMPIQPLLSLILRAANNLCRLQEGALEDAEAAKLSFVIADVTNDLTALTVA